MHSLGVLLILHPELPRKSGEPEKMLETAAQAGSWRSSMLLGILARDGKDRAVDEAEAFRWFLIAAGQGGAEAQQALAKDLAACRAALSLAAQTSGQQQANAWLQQHDTKMSFLFGDRFRKRLFPIAEIREPMTLTLN